MNPLWLLFAAVVGATISAVSSYIFAYTLPRRTQISTELKEILQNYALLSAKYWTSTNQQSHDRIVLEVEMKLSMRRIRNRFRYLCEQYRRFRSVQRKVASQVNNLDSESTGGCFECAEWQSSEDRARKSALIVGMIMDNLPE